MSLLKSFYQQRQYTCMSNVSFFNTVHFVSQMFLPRHATKKCSLHFVPSFHRTSIINTLCSETVCLVGKENVTTVTSEWRLYVCRCCTHFKTATNRTTDTLHH